MRDTTELEDAWRSLARDAAAAARAAGTLNRVTKTLSRAEGYESLKGVQQALAKLAAVSDLPPELLAAAEVAAAPVAAWLEEEWARRAAGFVDEATRYFTERSVPLEVDGFTLASPPLVLEVHPAADRAELMYAGELLKGKLPLVAERLLREREGALARLQRDATPADALADQLIEAYDNVVRLKGLRAGARVRLPDVHFQLFVDRQTSKARQSLTRSALKEYPRAQFAFDLMGLLSAPSFLRREGRTLELVEASPSLARSRSSSVTVVAMDGATTTWSDLRVG